MDLKFCLYYMQNYKYHTTFSHDCQPIITLFQFPADPRCPKLDCLSSHRCPCHCSPSLCQLCMIPEILIIFGLINDWSIIKSYACTYRQQTTNLLRIDLNWKIWKVFLNFWKVRFKILIWLLGKKPKTFYSRLPVHPNVLLMTNESYKGPKQPFSKE